jgi:hypothetical protein
VSESAATPFDGFLARVDEVEGGLRRVAAAGAPQGLTAPDEPSGEQWEAGQVWAHLAEFVPYWIGEARSVLTAKSDQPVPFGRVKTDPGRIAAIAGRRNEPVGVLGAKTAADVRDLRSFLREVDREPANWSRVGLHPKLGEMTITRIFEEFLVGHLEEHVRQLDGLRERSST